AGFWPLRLGGDVYFGPRWPNHCRLECHRQPPVSLELEVEVDFAAPFAGSDQDAWEAEYLAKVRELVVVKQPSVQDPNRRYDDPFVEKRLLRPALAVGGGDEEYDRQ